MIIKVCGITRKEQYEELVQIGLEMIGFNFYKPSKRYLAVPLDKVSGKSLRVGVFVNPTEDEVYDTVERHALDMVQLNGNESVEHTEKLAKNHRIIKVFGLDDDFDFNETKAYEPFTEYFLFDTKTPLFGGSGKKFNWAKLAEYQGSLPFLLSGGIQPEDNLAINGIKHEKFAGVDINSGFENSPGIKNIELIQQFKSTIEHEESR